MKRNRQDEQPDWRRHFSTREGQGHPDWRDEYYDRRPARKGTPVEWEGDRGMEDRRHWEYWNEPYEGLGGRGWREGWDDAMHREGPFAGRGPRNYRRADNRIEEDVNERLTRHSMIDATEIEVTVQNGEVTLQGFVVGREAKRMAEDIADSVFGVKDVNNQIKIRQRDEQEEARPESDTSSKQRRAS